MWIRASGARRMIVKSEVGVGIGAAAPESVLRCEYSKYALKLPGLGLAMQFISADRGHYKAL
jgi:hypothetical protein